MPVSGKVEAGDRGFEEALRRELGEELGLSSARRVFPLDWSVDFPGPDGRHWRLHAFGVELDRPFDPKLSPEHEAFEWVPFDEAARRLHYPDNRAAVERLRERLARPAVNL